jgi:hypothetical protein
MPFEKVNFQPAISPRSIALAGTGNQVFFCASTSEGIPVVSQLSLSGWGPLKDVRALATPPGGSIAANDPGFVTKVSCAHGFGYLTFYGLVQGTVWGTHISPYGADEWSALRDPRTPPQLHGWFNLTGNLGLPANAGYVAAGAVPQIGLSQVLLGPNVGAIQHVLMWNDLNPRLENQDARLGSLGAIRSAALASGAGHMREFIATDDGRLAVTTRMSGDDSLSAYRILGPESFAGSQFFKVAATEMVELPLGLTEVSHVTEPYHEVFTFADSDDFEHGYRLYDGHLGNNVLATIGPLNGGQGEIRLPRSSLEPGRKYSFALAPFAAGGEVRRDVSGGGLVTLARPFIKGIFVRTSDTRVEWGWIDNSQGAANLAGTRAVKIVARRVADGTEVESSLILNIDNPNENNAFFLKHKVNNGTPCCDHHDPKEWEFQAIAFDGRSPDGVVGNTHVESSLPVDLTNVGTMSAPTPTASIPPPTCCFDGPMKEGEE